MDIALHVARDVTGLHGQSVFSIGTECRCMGVNWPWQCTISLAAWPIAAWRSEAISAVYHANRQGGLTGLGHIVVLFA